MPPVVRGIVFAIFGVLLVFKLVRAARFGTVSSRGMTFDFASSPIWFTFGVGCYVLLLIFCGAEILSVFRVMPDPTITEGLSHWLVAAGVLGRYKCHP